MTTGTKRLLLCAVLIVLVTSIAFAVSLITRSGPHASGPLRVPLADGRILQIEAVTYGTIHIVGKKSVVLQRFGRWLPAFVRQRLTPKLAHVEVRRDKPGLAVWVTALDAVTGTNVDCQGLRVEFADKHGDLFAPATSSWSRRHGFGQEAHVFDAYPRGEHKLRLRITPWRTTNVTASIDIRNPKVHRAAPWVGRTLPQTNRVGDMDVVLKELVLRTNGGPKMPWQTPGRFWQPVFELRRGESLVRGWNSPFWTAEDATGNRGRSLGVHQPVLKYAVTIYPSATNLEASKLIASLPTVPVASLATNVLWNLRFLPGNSNLLAYGIFPPGTTVFEKGRLRTDIPPSVARGSRGWSSRGSINSHDTRLPTLYLQLPKPAPGAIFAVRLRDDRNRYWVAAPDAQHDRVHAYHIKIPPHATTIAPELVELKAVKTEFMASTPVVRSH